MNGHRKLSDLRRGHFVREPKHQFFLFCEGRSTEPNYFMALQSSLPNALIKIECDRGAGVPRTLAEKAAKKATQLGIASRKKKQNSFEEHDEYGPCLTATNTRVLMRQLHSAKVGVWVSPDQIPVSKFGFYCMRKTLTTQTVDMLFRHI